MLIIFVIQVSMERLPSHMMCGEVQQVMGHLHNTGTHTLSSLLVASTHPEFFTFGSPQPDQQTDSSSVYPVTGQADGQENVVVEPQLKHVVSVPVPGGSLKPGASVSLPMWIRGPDMPGEQNIRFLFYYKSTESNPKLRYE